MFNERLKYLRQENKLTQEELGKVLNKTKNNLSQYETGKREPDNDTLIRIADYFSVSIDYLLGRTDTKELNDKIIDPSSNNFNNIAFNRKDEYIEELPVEAREEIEKFKEYIRHKYNKKSNE